MEGHLYPAPPTHVGWNELIHQLLKLQNVGSESEYLCLDEQTHTPSLVTVFEVASSDPSIVAFKGTFLDDAEQ